jgi:DNA-directed RNA polymerase subunit RPC12/RpoP
MAFTVEQACVQCGAPIELEETDRLLQCPYCRVKSFLFASDHFRYVLPNKAPDKEIVYAPYLRFKGSVFTCQGLGINHRFLDITQLAAPVPGLPMSLGFRSQVLKLSFLKPDTVGSFLPSSLHEEEMLSSAGRRASGSGKLFHTAYIGDVISVIYQPLFIEKETVFDAITRTPTTELPHGKAFFSSSVNFQSEWKLFFMGTLCPQCGWNLDGERDSVVLTCPNCDSAWEASEGKFARIKVARVRGNGQNTVYLPFWRFKVSTTGVPINSYADFIRVTNQPKVVKKEWEAPAMSFWSPAFKIRPQVFLRVASQLTIVQKDFEMREGLPEDNLHPVTMPLSEAVQSLKLILASAAYTKKRTYPLLPEIQFNLKDTSIVYVPFTDEGHDLVHQHIRLSINKNALQFGRSL